MHAIIKEAKKLVSDIYIFLISLANPYMLPVIASWFTTILLKYAKNIKQKRVLLLDIGVSNIALLKVQNENLFIYYVW